MAASNQNKILSHLFAFLSFLTVCAVSNSLVAQTGKASFPGGSFYQARSILNDGELRDGLRAFRNAARDGYITGIGRWVDSICYYTMMGECLYQAGDLPGAMEQYDAALNLYLGSPQFAKKADFQIEIPPATSAIERTRISWGVSSRTTIIARVQDEVPILIGSDVNKALSQGGVVQPAEYRRFNLHEIVRCTAIAMARRREILGPVGKHDAFTRQVASATSAGLGNRHPLAQSWGALLQGIGYTMSGDDVKAAAALRLAIQAANKFDHPLTPLALLELARLNFRNQKYEDAGKLSLEAGYSAAIFGNQDVLRESFEIGTACHLILKREGIYAPLEPASGWARTRASRQVQSSLALLATQCATESGLALDANKLLGVTRKQMGRSDLMNSILGTDFLYRSAQVNFQQADTKSGYRNLAAALKSQIASSKWLLQIKLTDAFYASGRITPHSAGKLFEELLREPTYQDWLVNPIETLAYVSSSQMVQRQRYLAIAIAAKDYDKALEISDDIRRHRFFASLPIGGRIMSMRWMLEGDEDELPPETVKIKQAFLLKYPRYGELSRRAGKVLAELKAMPFVPADDAPEKLKQRDLLSELDKLAALQELVLADVALRREPSSFVFPPPLMFEQKQAEMKAGQAIVSFVETPLGVYSFLMTKDKYGFQQLTKAGDVRKQLTDLLKKLGNLDPNNQVNAEVFTQSDWKAPASALMQLLLPKATPQFWDSINELVVVPDGLLWYLPFEILQVAEGAGSVNLYDKVKIRYAPTVSTAVSKSHPVKPTGTAAFITGRMYLGDDLEISADAFEAVKEKMTGAAKVPFKLPGQSNVFSALCDQLVVWDEIDESMKSGLYQWSPFQLDRGKPGSTLASWMGLPWSGPEQIYLPGFHTNAATGLRNRTDGSEIFLTVCGLMASGARTVLMSRWRVGGQSSYQLTEKLVRGVSKKGALNAWRDSVDDFHLEELAIEKEPRIRKPTKEVDIESAHPFFWSGYMLIDRGDVPRK